MDIAAYDRDQGCRREALPPPLRLGVALGGGSARGYAHIGALASLERHHLAPEVIVGVSFGALVGALYASGKPLGEMTAYANQLRRRDVWPQLADFGLHKAALFRGEKLETYFERLTEGRSFEDLGLELVVVATDVDTGEPVLLRHGPLSKALRASTSLPGLFAPYDYQGRRLVDGGLGSPVPLEALQGLEVDLAIGIGASIESGDSLVIQLTQRVMNTTWGQHFCQRLRDLPGSHALRLLGRALAHTAGAWQAREYAPASALQVQTRPPIRWFNFHQADLAIHAGEEALERFIPTIEAAVKKLQHPPAA